MITGVLAQSTVSDLSRAEAWYTSLLGRGPDSRPMDGLLEWEFGSAHGLQVWVEPARAGHSTVVLEESDLDAAAEALAARGIAHQGPQPASSSRILPLLDPDGNRVVLTGR